MGGVQARNGDQGPDISGQVTLHLLGIGAFAAGRGWVPAWAETLGSGTPKDDKSVGCGRIVWDGAFLPGLGWSTAWLIRLRMRNSAIVILAEARIQFLPVGSRAMAPGNPP